MDQLAKDGYTIIENIFTPSEIVGEIEASDRSTEGFRVTKDLFAIRRFLQAIPLAMKILGLIKSPIFLSPNGMLKSSALKLKSSKKKIFLFTLNLIRIQRVIIFHATDDQESDEIVKVFGKKTVVFKIYHAPPIPENKIFFTKKRPGELKLIFLGRIHPIKNLYFLIECLRKLSHKVELTVVGPIEDEDYFFKCEDLIKSLPENITVSFAGAIDNRRVKNYLKENHFLVLPTMGENFGYAILEAFCVGRPVIITNRTPWKDLQKQGIGWDLPLNSYNEFVTVIGIAANMTQDEYNKWSESSWHFACSIQKNPIHKDHYCQMFNKLTQ